MDIIPTYLPGRPQSDKMDDKMDKMDMINPINQDYFSLFEDGGFLEQTHLKSNSEHIRTSNVRLPDFQKETSNVEINLGDNSTGQHLTHMSEDSNFNIQYPSNNEQFCYEHWQDLVRYTVPAFLPAGSENINVTNTHHTNVPTNFFSNTSQHHYLANLNTRDNTNAGFNVLYSGPSMFSNHSIHHIVNEEPYPSSNIFQQETYQPAQNYKYDSNDWNDYLYSCFYPSWLLHAKKDLLNNTSVIQPAEPFFNLQNVLSTSDNKVEAEIDMVEDKPRGSTVTDFANTQQNLNISHEEIKVEEKHEQLCHHDRKIHQLRQNPKKVPKTYIYTPKLPIKKKKKGFTDWSYLKHNIRGASYLKSGRGMLGLDLKNLNTREIDTVSHIDEGNNHLRKTQNNCNQKGRQRRTNKPNPPSKRVSKLKTKQNTDVLYNKPGVIVCAKQYNKTTISANVYEEGEMSSVSDVIWKNLKYHSKLKQNSKFYVKDARKRVCNYLESLKKSNCKDVIKNQDEFHSQTILSIKLKECIRLNLSIPVMLKT